MVWIFLLLAIAVIYIAVTQRLEGLDERFELYRQKIAAAFAYLKEDIADVEAELKAKAAKQKAPEASPAKPSSTKTDQTNAP